MTRPADKLPAYLDGLGDMLQSGVAWLGMLGELTEAVRAEDWERAKRLAARRITYPQPYPAINRP